MSQEVWATQTGSFSAELTRRAVFAPYARTAANSPGVVSGGLLSTADLQLSAPASGLSVNVAAGEAIVGGTEGGVQGGYYARNTAQQNLVIATANATNPRIDTVVFTIGDSGYTEPSGITAGTNAAVLQVVTGTPTAGATLTNLSGAAAVPLSSLVLGYVLVPASATNIITADLANVASTAKLGLGTPEWAYAQITAPVNITDTSETTATALISAPAFTPDGAPVLVEFFCPFINVPTLAQGNTATITLFEGATEITRLAIATNISTTEGTMPPVYARYRFTPTNASHTYKVCAFVTNTTGTPSIGAGTGSGAAYPPAFVRFSKA